MGRAMLIIVTGLLVALGYTYTGMSGQRSLMTQQSVSAIDRAAAENLAFTGIQFAIDRFNDNNSWRGPETLSFEGGEVEISVTEITPDALIEVRASTNTGGGTGNTVVATYDISEKEQLVPDLSSSLGISTNNFSFSLGDSARITGYDQTGQCTDVAGVRVNSQTAKEKVGTDSRIDGTPEDEAAVDVNSYDLHAELVNRLADNSGTKKLSGSYSGDLGTQENPGVFFVEDYTKLTGGISEGYGILVIRDDGELNLDNGLDMTTNFTFNGLVIFEDAYRLDATGTPAIHGSVVVGSTDGSQISTDISGDLRLQYDCTAKAYADMAVEELITPDRIYQQVSFYQ